MDRSTTVTLVSYTRTQDNDGIWRDTVKTTRDVFAQVDSVTRAEFFSGGQNGLRPDLKFAMFYADYEGESELIYEGKTYSIYRSFYGRGDVVELYTERKVGVDPPVTITTDEPVVTT